MPGYATGVDAPEPPAPAGSGAEDPRPEDAGRSPFPAAGASPAPGADQGPRSAPPSLGARALRSSAWTIGGHAAGQLIRFANNLALTHLFAPEHPEYLGLMSTVYVFLSGLHLMSDFGVGPSIIQNPRGADPRFYNTAWTLHVVRGAAIALIMLPLGVLLAGFYAGKPGAEKLVWLVPTVGATALIAGLQSTAFYTLNRNLRLRPVVLLDVSAQLLGCATGVACAAYDPSLWALVAGVFTHQVVYAVGSHCLGTRNWLQWDPEAARTIARFGRWIWLSTMLTWTAGQVDRLVMPLLLRFDGLAVYHVALLIAAAVPEAAHLVGSRILFPLVSELVRCQDPALAARLLRVRTLIVVPGAACLVLLSLCGEPLIRLLYPDGFHGAGWMLRILAAAAIPQVLTASAWYVFFAMGQSFVPMCLQAGRVLLKGAAMAVGYSVGGPTGVIVGLAVAEGVQYPLVAVALRAHGVFQPRLDVPVLLASAAILLAGAWL